MNKQPEERPQTLVRSATIGYAITALIFFVLGFLLAALLEVNLLGDEESNVVQVNVDQASIDRVVNATFIALTPSPQPTPTRVPVELTYAAQNYSIGNPDAPITLVEFSDYRCPYCASFALGTLDQLLERYGDQIQFVYRDYPIFGEVSERAAHAAYCADQQDQFWVYHDQIFERQYAGETRTDVDDTMLLNIARDLELDMTQFETCLADDTFYQFLSADVEEALSLIGNQGTPFFLLNGIAVRGNQPLSYFVYMIDNALREQGIEPPS